jgi:hypothetical protein
MFFSWKNKIIMSVLFFHNRDKHKSCCSGGCFALSKTIHPKKQEIHLEANGNNTTMEKCTIFVVDKNQNVLLKVSPDDSENTKCITVMGFEEDSNVQIVSEHYIFEKRANFCLCLRNIETQKQLFEIVMMVMEANGIRIYIQTVFYYIYYGNERFTCIESWSPHCADSSLKKALQFLSTKGYVRQKTES